MGASVPMQPIRPNVGKMLGAGCQLLFGGFFTLIASFIFFGSWSVNAPWYFLAFTGVFLAFGLGMIGNALWILLVKPMLTGMAFGPASASLSSYELRLGDNLSVQYEQAALRAAQVRRVLIQLVLREHATYRRGTNTYTAYFDRVVAQHEGAGRPLARGDVLSESCTLRIPTDSMHSMEAPRNKLVWMAKIQVDVPGTPDVTEEIVFRVAPALAEGMS